MFPPPTTATVSFLKRLPSHVAQKDIPFPISSFSFSNPKILGFRPVARIMFSAVYSPFSVTTFFSFVIQKILEADFDCVCVCNRIVQSVVRTGISCNRN